VRARKAPTGVTSGTQTRRGQAWHATH